MRVTGTAERAGAEECAAQVGGPAARACHELPVRAFERRAVASEHPGLREDCARVLGARDGELVARRPVERVAAVRADLRADAQRAQERERAAGDGGLGDVEVEVDDAAAAEVDGAGRVEQRGGLRETVAARRGCDRGELRTGVLDEGLVAHSVTPSSASSLRFVCVAVRPVPADAVRGDDPVVGEHERDTARRAEAAGGACGARPTGERRELAVGDDLAPRHRAQRERQLGLERRRVAELDLDVVVGDPRSGQMRREAGAQIRHERVTPAWPGGRVP